MKKVSLLFFSVMFVIGTDTFLISPLLPTLRNAYHISTGISGFLVSAYALGYAIFAFIAGPISDRFDRKKVMSIGLLAFAVSTFLCGLSPNFYTMILFRFLAGVSASFVTPQVWASIPVLVEPKNIVKSMGYATAGLSISQMLGIPIGSYLAALSWHTPFFVISACAIILMIFIFISLSSLPSAIDLTKKRNSVLQTYMDLFKTSKALPYIFAYFVFQTGNFAAFSFIGSWFTADFSLQVASVGAAMIALGLGNTFGSLFGSQLIKKMGEPKSLFLALIGMIVLYAILPFSINLVMAEIVLFVIFLIGGFIFPVFMSTFQSLTTTARGTISAVSNAAMYGGTTLGGAIGGFLLAHFSGFIGIAFFTVIMYTISLLVYTGTGIFRVTKGIKKTSQKVQKVN